jgi:hypothetical protein
MVDIHDNIKPKRVDMLDLHFSGKVEDKKVLLERLRKYWETHDDEDGLRDIKMRIFRNMLFEEEQIEIDYLPQDQEGWGKKEGSIWNEKKDADFADSFFFIVLTMINRRGWWCEKEKAYPKSLPRNLRIVLRHWSKQVYDILEPDALCQAIYQMNNINYLALAVANIERARRLRISEASTNINNAIIDQLIDAAEKYCKLVEDKGKLGPLYMCENEYLSEVIRLQRILALARTSNHAKTIADSTELIEILDVLRGKNPKDFYLDVLYWWAHYVMYRSYMTTNNFNKANKESGPLKQMETLENEEENSNGKSIFLKKLFTDHPLNDEKIRTNNVLRINLRMLKTYYETRVKELKLKRGDKNKSLKVRNDPVKIYALKDAWKDWKKKEQKNTTILYTVIHSGRKEDSDKRKFAKTGPRTPQAYVHKQVVRIKKQIVSVYEALENICSRNHHLAPMQLLLLLHDFMYRMEEEFLILSKKRRRNDRQKHLSKDHPLGDIKEWVENSCCDMLIGVLEAFKREIIEENSRFGLQLNELKQAIPFWISKLKKVDSIKKGDISEKQRIKNICKGIAGIFCTAVYGDKNSEGEWDIGADFLALYYKKEGEGASKCFKIYKPIERLAGAGLLKMP